MKGPSTALRVTNKKDCNGKPDPPFSAGHAQILMVIQRSTFSLPVFPVHIFWRHTVLFHRDASVNRANQFAQITTHTFFLFHGVIVIWITSFDIDRLMRRVFASDVTQPTVDTFILVNFCNMMVIDIQIFPMCDFFNRFSDEVLYYDYSILLFFICYYLTAKVVKLIHKKAKLFSIAIEFFY